MWLVQRHICDSDGLDYFKLFTNYEMALDDYRKIIKNNLEFIDIEFYEENAENMETVFKSEDLLNEKEGMVFLTDGDYLSLMEIKPDGEYSRSRH